MGLHHRHFKKIQRALGVPMILGLLRDRDGGQISARTVFGTRRVPSWFQPVPAGYQLGTSWVPAGTQLVPASTQLVPRRTSWVPAG